MSGGVDRSVSYACFLGDGSDDCLVVLYTCFVGDGLDRSVLYTCFLSDSNNDFALKSCTLALWVAALIDLCCTLGF